MKVSTGKYNFDQAYSFNYDNNDLEYEDIQVILKDSQVRSKMNIRIENSLDFPMIWNEETVKSDVLEYIKSVYYDTAINWVDFPLFILSGLYNAQSVTEAVYQKDEDESISLKEFASISLNDVRFDTKGELINSHTEKKINTDHKFLVYKHGIDAEHINGQSIFSTSILNLVTFKKRIVILLDQLLDKFGVPSVTALLENISSDPATAKQITDDISEALESLRSGAGVALANVKELKTLEATGTAKDFEKAQLMADEEIAKIILGTSRTTDSQSKGSYASDRVSENVTFRKAKSDNKIIEKYLNQVFRWLVDVRYGVETEAPTVSFDRSDNYSFEDITKAIELGDKWIDEKEYRKYVPKAQNEEDRLIIETPQQQPQFSEKKKLIIR